MCVCMCTYSGQQKSTGRKASRDRCWHLASRPVCCTNKDVKGSTGHRASVLPQRPAIFIRSRALSVPCPQAGCLPDPGKVVVHSTRKEHAGRVVRPSQKLEVNVCLLLSRDVLGQQGVEGWRPVVIIPRTAQFQTKPHSTAVGAQTNACSLMGRRCGTGLGQPRELSMGECCQTVRDKTSLWETSLQPECTGTNSVQPPVMY